MVASARIIRGHFPRLIIPASVVVQRIYRGGDLLCSSPDHDAYLWRADSILPAFAPLFSC